MPKTVFLTPRKKGIDAIRSMLETPLETKGTYNTSRNVSIVLLYLTNDLPDHPRSFGIEKSRISSLCDGKAVSITKSHKSIKKNVAQDLI